jgi:PKD repeat protein
MIKDVTMRFLLGGVAFLVASGFPAVTTAQTRTLRIVTYNIEDDISGATVPLPGLIAPSGGSVTNGGVLEGIGEEILGSDPAQPLDILALQETTSNGTTVQPIVNGLNAFYLSRNIPAGYAMSTVQGTESGGDTADGNGPNAIVYNTNTVQLIASVPVDPSGGTSKLGSASGEYREVMRYEFAPAGVTPTTNNEFYIYVSHYKSGTTSADLTARTGESGIIRTNSATLPSNARVLYVGDFNVSTSSEVSYQNIVGSTLVGIQGIDPFNTNGTTGINWANGSQLAVKTESATDLHYRDDFQVVSSNVFAGAAGGLALVSGTYHTFGNNGTTPYQGSVNSGNTSLNSDLTTNVTGISATQLYQYLTTASDHLPVVADYTIPVPSSAPVASFTGSPVSGVAPLAVTFTDTSSGSITNWSWNFGDGGTTNLATNTVLYTYSTAGVYSVTETVSGSGGSGTNTQVNYIAVLTPFQAWQIQYFGSTTNPAAASGADPDGDGQNNLAEFLAGTIPTNSASGLRITSITAQGSDVQVTWATAGGQTDVVQATAGLLDGSYSTNFLDLSPLIIISGSGDAITNYLDNGGATNVPGRYYRVRMQP